MHQSDHMNSDTVTNERPIAPRQAVVHDMSGEEDRYQLDTHGFQLLQHESQEKTFEDEERIKTEYYKECEEVYKRV